MHEAACGVGRLARVLAGIVAALSCLPAMGYADGPRSDASATVAGLALEEALRLGERIYRQGIGADGAPLQAIVADDVRVSGEMFTCVTCHQRSGLGSVEGPVVAWPITGKELWAPMRRAKTWNPAKQHDGPGAAERWMLPPHLQPADQRPPYDDETLARVLRTGIDPNGRSLNRAMPRFDLGERDMALLTNYLKRLSRDTDPGADDRTLRFATVVTEGVDAADRDAMLATLRATIDAHNVQTRPYERRAKLGPFYKTEKYGAYRRLELEVWELSGAPPTWRAQLEERYAQRPVFALVGGIAAGSWAPIHEFCEARRIPSIFPLTDRPVVSESDWYTLYFSKGLYQEGEAAARFLRAPGRLTGGTRILQVFRAGSRGEEAARAVREILGEDGAFDLTELEAGKLSTDLPSPDAGEKTRNAAWLLWLDGPDLRAAVESLTVRAPSDTMIIASWTLGHRDLDRSTKEVRDRLYLTYPHMLPEERQHRWEAIDRWLDARRIPAEDPDIQGNMYFLGRMLPAAIGYLRNEFYRDYFLEAFDMMPQQDFATPAYPRLSFGPGQRYAAKGCYITRLSTDDPPRLLQVSDWVVN